MVVYRLRLRGSPRPIMKQLCMERWRTTGMVPTPHPHPSDCWTSPAGHHNGWPKCTEQSS